MITAGNLRHKCYLQKNTGTQDTASGAIVDSWTNVRSIYAELLRMPANERIESQQVTPESLIDIRVRYADDIFAERRLLVPRNTDTLASAIASGAVTSITINDANLCPDARFSFIRIEDEFLTVTAGYGTTTLTVTRGAFGSSAVAHSSSTVIIRMGVAEILSIVNTNNIKEEMILKCKEVDV